MAVVAGGGTGRDVSPTNENLKEGSPPPPHLRLSVPKISVAQLKISLNVKNIPRARDPFINHFIMLGEITFHETF